MRPRNPCILYALFVLLHVLAIKGHHQVVLCTLNHKLFSATPPTLANVYNLQKGVVLLLFPLHWIIKNVGLLNELLITIHVRWVPCHHGMARPQVADGGDAFHLWRAAANIFNKQTRRADKGWFSSLELGVGLTTPHRKR
jgi:hypothetical protein